MLRNRRKKVVPAPVCWPLRLTIPGDPIIKKNRRPIYRDEKTGKPFTGKTDQLIAWESDAIIMLEEQARVLPSPLHEPLVATFLIYRQQKPGAPGDLSNYYEGPQDALERAGVIENDRLIRSHDGSRIFQDTENPRVDILLWPMDRCPYLVNVFPYLAREADL